jgi:hypothetical protein
VIVKIEKQAYQLAEWIVVSQLKTVLNDKFRTYFVFKSDVTLLSDKGTRKANL